MPPNNTPTKPPYWKPTQPSMKRRSKSHDYTERGIYMITMATEGRKPLFGKLVGKAEAKESPDSPHIELSPLGKRVVECWYAIHHFHPEIEVIKLCVMPDHIHGILFVKEKIEKHLGHVIWGFKFGTTKAALELGIIAADIPQHTKPATQPTLPTGTTLPSGTTPPSGTTLPTGTTLHSGTTLPNSATAPLFPSGSSVSFDAVHPHQQDKHKKKGEARKHGDLWETNYNDRILLHKGPLQRMIAYLDDNPRRLLMKREHPEFFTNLGTLTVAGITMQAMGNRFLLDNPVKRQVQCSRHLYPHEIEALKEAFLEDGRKGAVLVSPCISPGESIVATAALENGVALIVLLLNGLPPYYKPKPRYLEACAKGRLLLLAPFPYQTEKIAFMRQRCLQLNDIAAKLCDEQA